MENYFEENGNIKINYGATEIFSEILYSTISKLFSLMNLSRPGCIRARCIFIDRYFISKELCSTVPDIKVFNIADTANFMQYQYDDNDYMGKGWSKLCDISLKDIWIWHKKVSYYSKRRITNVTKALERYFLLFTTNHITEILLISVAALEALYILPFTVEQKKQKNLPSIQAQLITNIPLFLNLNKLLPDKDFKKIIRTIYNQRSRIIHGDKHMPNPFRKSFNNDIHIQDAASEAIFLIVSSLREICKFNLMELTIETINKNIGQINK